MSRFSSSISNAGIFHKGVRQNATILGTSHGPRPRRPPAVQRRPCGAVRPRSAVPKRCRARGTPAPYLSTSLRSKTGMAGARGGRSPETVPIQSVSLELFIAISVACGDICPRAAGPACRRGPPSPRNTCCAAQNRVVPIARRGPGRKTRPARPPCCGWPASWSISPSRGRKNSRVTRLCARTWLEFRAAALKSRPAGDPADKGSPRIQTVAFCRTLDWDSPLGPRLTIAPTPAGLVGITGESPPARLLHAGGQPPESRRGGHGPYSSYRKLSEQRSHEETRPIRSSWRIPIERIDLVGAGTAHSDEGVVRSRREPQRHPHVLQGREALCFSVAHAHSPPGRILTVGHVEQGFTVLGPGRPTARLAGKLGLLLRLKIVEHELPARRGETRDESPIGRPAEAHIPSEPGRAATRLVFRSAT